MILLGPNRATSEQLVAVRFGEPGLEPVSRPTTFHHEFGVELFVLKVQSRSVAVCLDMPGAREEAIMAERLTHEPPTDQANPGP